MNTMTVQCLVWALIFFSPLWDEIIHLFDILWLYGQVVRLDMSKSHSVEI